MKLKIKKDLTVNLKGILYEDLDDILVAASLEHYRLEEEISTKVSSNEVENNNIAKEKIWVKNLRNIIDSLEKMISNELNRRNRRKS